MGLMWKTGTGPLRGEEACTKARTTGRSTVVAKALWLAWAGITPVGLRRPGPQAKRWLGAWGHKSRSGRQRPVTAGTHALRRLGSRHGPLGRTSGHHSWLRPGRGGSRGHSSEPWPWEAQPRCQSQRVTQSTQGRPAR